VITPTDGASGQTIITVQANDGAQNTTRTFLVTISDAVPVLAPIADQTVHADEVLFPLLLNVSDDLTTVRSITLSAASSNQAVVPNSGVRFFLLGSGEWAAGITPADHVKGQTVITITATDSGNQTVTRSFTLDVTNDPPEITGLTDWTTAMGNEPAPLPFDVGDDHTLFDALVVTATSSNTDLVPNANIAISGSDGSSGRTITVSPVFGILGSTVITVTASDGMDTSTATFTFTVVNMPAYFMAEGATSAFFNTDILIANPNTAPAPITLTFFKNDGTYVERDMTLPATSRTTVVAKSITGLESANFSSAVTSNNNLPLVVERTMSWDATGYGSSGEKASRGPAYTWYFAEGSQGYFHTFFLLLNPHLEPNVAHVTYYLENGEPVQRDYPLQPTSRRTVDIAAEPALANQSFGAVIAFDLNGMAERAMYFGDAPLFSGGHDSSGTLQPGTSWFLAEGATGSFFDTFILLANPNDTAATITTTYLPTSGTPIPKTHTIAPHQRLTINIAEEDPALASAAVATSVASDLPIVAERSQYWPHGGWYEAHNSAGESRTGTHWGLAEGRVGGTNNAQTYILLANPGMQDATATLTFLRTDGTTIVKEFVVPATSRRNVAVTGPGSDVPELANESFGTVIHSTQPIVVERSMYTDANGVTWAAGTNATATRLLQ
jgi:hypothetical protein